MSVIPSPSLACSSAITISPPSPPTMTCHTNSYLTPFSQHIFPTSKGTSEPIDSKVKTNPHPVLTKWKDRPTSHLNLVDHQVFFCLCLSLCLSLLYLHLSWSTHTFTLQTEPSSHLVPTLSLLPEEQARDASFLSGGSPCLTYCPHMKSKSEGRRGLPFSCDISQIEYEVLNEQVVWNDSMHNNIKDL